MIDRWFILRDYPALGGTIFIAWKYICLDISLLVFETGIVVSW